MGFFTLCVAATLVVLQSTTILLQRASSEWTFHLVQVSSIRGDPNHNTSLSLLLRRALLNESDSQLKAPNNYDQNSNEEALLFNTNIDPVLAPWNPHLIVLALTCLQCLFALARVNSRYGSQQQHPIPIAGAGVVLSIILLAAAIVQGVHSSDLVHYPTMLVIGALWLHGLYLVVSFSRNSGRDYAAAVLFHNYTRTIAVPLATLASMVFGARLWVDALSHWVLLQVASTVGWVQVASSPSAPNALRRAVIVGFVLLPTLVAISSTGRDDQWRYVAILAGSVGLLPLIGVSTVVQETRTRTLAGQVLIANNAALVAIIATLANF